MIPQENFYECPEISEIHMFSESIIASSLGQGADLDNLDIFEEEW